jgi:hypothetical protein
VTSTSIDRHPLLLGHRGARRAAPENTLAAFDLALQHGCDGFEFDVRRTLDGRSLPDCASSKLRATLTPTCYDVRHPSVVSKMY